MQNKTLPKIVSILHKAEIDKFCINLPKISNTKHFVCYLTFNNGQTFVLSNIYHMLVPYYMESLYQEDFSFRREITSQVTHYLCDKTASVSSRFSDMLAHRFNVHRAYYIIRNSPECQFVFGCIPDKQPEDYKNFYNYTLSRFEDFCVDFVDNAIDIIKKYNPNYANAIVLNDKFFRRKVIKSHENKIQLTKKELEVLHWIAYGKSSEETAIIMSEKINNINYFRNQLKSKFDTTNLAQTIFEGMRQGYIGCFNSSWSGIDYVLSNLLPPTSEDDEEYTKNVSNILTGSQIVQL